MSMTMKLRALVIGLLLTLAAPLSAFAQCSGSAPASTYCGNPTGALALPGWKPLSGIPFPSIAGGTVVGNRGTATGAAAALTNPVLGIPGTSSGQLGFAGSAGGTATIVPQATAGSPVLTLPNTSGTFAVGATTPLSLSATTGALTCATCVTSSGGGAITGTAPISVSAAGVVSINAPYTTLTANNGGIVYSGATNLAILAGTATARQMLQSGVSSAPAWSSSTYPATSAAGTVLASLTANTITASSTPVLGASGTLGSMGFGNATSGIVTLQPVAGALGTITVSIPSAAGTMAVSASSPLALNATTGALTLGNIPVTNLNSGTSASSATFWRGDGTWATPAGGSPITSSSAQAFAVGPNGNTNPVFNIDASVPSAATGISVQGQAAGAGASITLTSSAGSDALSINAKGSGALNLGTLTSATVAIGTSGYLQASSSGSVTLTSSSAQALAVGRNGGTNPAFNVDNSTASSATGLNIKSAAAGSGIAVAAISSGANENITINAKATGTIGIGNVSTGAVTITPPTTHSGTTTLSGALTYGGVTLNNAVTGTGNMVLSASPTLTGTPVLAAPSATTMIVGSSTTLPASDMLVVSANSTTLPAVGGGAIIHMGGANGGGTAFYLDAFAVNPTFAFRRSNTTAASPSAIQSGDIVMNFVGLGYGTTGYAASARSYVRSFAAENWSDTAQGMYVSVGTTPATTAAAVEAIRIQASGGLSIGTSTDPGIGGLQINAQAFIPNALSDAGLTDATACLRASTGQVLKGSGTLGICLGTSGAQFKTAFAPMVAGLDEISKLDLINYRYKTGFGDGGERVQYGLTAQQVATVMPDLVRYDKNGDAINFDIGALLPVALHAIQQLKADNEDLRREINQLRK